MFPCQTLSSNFSLCTKIEILKHVPEGDETEQGLQRELRVLRYIICSYDYFLKNYFLIQPGLLYLELRFFTLAA